MIREIRSKFNQFSSLSMKSAPCLLIFLSRVQFKFRRIFFGRWNSGEWRQSIVRKNQTEILNGFLEIRLRQRVRQGLKTGQIRFGITSVVKKPVRVPFIVNENKTFHEPSRSSHNATWKIADSGRTAAASPLFLRPFRR